MRYKVYGWTREDTENCEIILEESMCNALERGSYEPYIYGTLIGETDDEEEALELTGQGYYNASVWDTQERQWFN